MVAADAILKCLYSKLFHMAGIAHLLHNCAMKIKSLSDNVIQLTAKIQSATVKNETRQSKFATNSCPYQPMLQDGKAG